MAEQQTALITAGGSGIGLQMAHQFLANGYQVAITDIDKAAAQTPHNRPCPQLSVCTQMLQMRTVCARLNMSWTTAGHRLDVVMANAGIAGPTSYVEDVKLEDWKHCIAVNLDGAFLASADMQPAG